MLHVLGQSLPATVDPAGTFRIKTPGRRLKRRLETANCEGDDVDLERQLRQSVETIFRGSNMSACIIFRSSVSGYSFALLCRLQCMLGLHLVPIFESCANGAGVTAFCLVQRVPPGSDHTKLFMRDYLLQLSLRLPPTFQSLTTVTAHVCDWPEVDTVVDSLTSYALYTLECKYCQLGSDVCNIIEQLIGSTHQSLFSDDLWEFLFASCVVRVPLPQIGQTLRSNLFCDLQESNPSLYSNRRHRFFSAEPGRAYWWDNLAKSAPFVSNINPPPLATLREKITPFFPQLELCPDMLTSEYRRGRDNLRSHRDRALIEHLQRPEFVALYFIGATRDLLFTPPPRYKHKFSQIIPSDCNDLVVMTPMANELFYHGKLPSNHTGETHALTLAFREGVKITEAYTKYPQLRIHFPNLVSEKEVTPIFGIVP